MACEVLMQINQRRQASFLLNILFFNLSMLNPVHPPFPPEVAFLMEIKNREAVVFNTSRLVSPAGFKMQASMRY